MSWLLELGYHPGDVAHQLLAQRVLREYVAEIHRYLVGIQLLLNYYLVTKATYMLVFLRKGEVTAHTGVFRQFLRGSVVLDDMPKAHHAFQIKVFNGATL